jgi:hypothetical protein
MKTPLLNLCHSTALNRKPHQAQLFRIFVEQRLLGQAYP